jgi:hypothetical protein
MEICIHLPSLTLLARHRARKFQSDTSGVTVDIGEAIRIEKNFYFNRSTTWLIEEVNITNIGSVDMSNVSIMWSIVPTHESALRNLTSDERFNYFHAVPEQGSPTHLRVLAQSKGLYANSGVSLGTLDVAARAWIKPLTSWEAADIESEFYTRRPYSAEWIYDDLAKGAAEGSATPIWGQYVQAIGSRRASLAVGQTTTFWMFWSFAPNDVELAFADLQQSKRKIERERERKIRRE